MVVLTALTASLYAAILIPFKVLPLIPGVTEFRPANAVPVVCSLLFGPAAAWGAAIGNVIGDFFGGLGPGDLFGFVGNFLYGFLPYRLWRTLSSRPPLADSLPNTLTLGFVILVAGGACALVIGWGLDLLGFVPFSILANVVLFNNVVVAAVLGPLLLRALYPRVAQARLHHEDVFPSPATSSLRRALGATIVTAAVAGGLLAGNALSLGYVTLPSALATGASGVGFGLLPFLALLILGLFLL